MSDSSENAETRGGVSATEIRRQAVRHLQLKLADFERKDIVRGVPKILAIKAIKAYQKTLSPDHGIFRKLYPDGFCRYYPSCSKYTAQAIENNGIFVGIGLGAWRIARCNPWSRGGFDPAPKLNK